MSDSPAKEPPKEPAPAKTKPRSRFRKWARRLVLGTASAFLVLVVWQLTEREWNRIRGESEHRLAVSNAEADDPNWTWEKLNAARPRPPEGKNAAALIPAIRPHLPDKWGKQLYAEEWAGRRNILPNVRYDAILLAEMRRELGAAAPGITLARTLKDYSFGHREHTLGPNVTDTKCEESQWTRNVVAALSWDAVQATEAGDLKIATDTLCAMIGACRSVGDEPTFIAYLIRSACRQGTVLAIERALAQSAALPELATLQTVLATEVEVPILLNGLRGERAMAHQLFENLRAGKTDIYAQTGPRPDAWDRFWWDFKYRGDRAADHARAIRGFTSAIEAARLPIEKQAAAFERLPTVHKDPDRVMSSLLLTPTEPKFLLGYVRNTALIRCAVAGIACERFRQAHGRWPNDLSEIAPTFIATVPLDPLTGETLQYKKADEGIIIFSPGRDGLEDGGSLDDPEKPGTIRIRFRLWNPDQRRLPPEPKPPEPEPADPEKGQP